MKKSIYFFLFFFTHFLAVLGNITALEFEEYPIQPYVDKLWYTDIGFSNDGFLGSGLTKDWDDNRTFGLSIRGELPFDIQYRFRIDSFTNRGDESRNLEAGRFDRLELGLGFPFFISQRDNMCFITSGGGSFFLDTNLGLYTIQTNYHEMIGQDRDVPKEYYSTSAGLQLYINQRYLLGRRMTGDFSGTFAFNTFLEPYLDLSAFLWDTATRSHIFIGLGYNVSFPRNGNREIFNSFAREQGVNFQYGIIMNHFFFFRTINLLDSGFQPSEDQKSLGGVGLRFGGGDQNSPYTRRGNLVCDQGFPVANRIQSQIIWQPDFYFSLFPVITERTGFYLSSSNGWERKDTEDHSELRFDAYSAGIRIYLFRNRPGWRPNFYLDMGPGIRWSLFYQNAGTEYAEPQRVEFAGFLEFREGVYFPYYGFGKKDKTEYGISFFLQQNIGFSSEHQYYNYAGEPATVGFYAGITFTFSDKNLYSETLW